jgi:hypothetical protein
MNRFNKKDFLSPLAEALDEECNNLIDIVTDLEEEVKNLKKQIFVAEQCMRIMFDSLCDGENMEAAADNYLKMYHKKYKEIKDE